MTIGRKTGGGSRAGKPNKVTKELKDMILGALDDAGGQQYLMECAQDPKTAPAFLALVGKVLPLQLSGDPANPFTLRIERVIVKPNA